MSSDSESENYDNSSDDSDEIQEIPRLKGFIHHKEGSLFYNPKTANIVCQLVFKLLNFFDFVKLDDVSEDFNDYIVDYFIDKYYNDGKKRALFEAFNLEEFLLDINRTNDCTDVLNKPKPIKLKEFLFIFKHFGFHMKTINIQTEYIETMLETADNINFDYLMFRYQLINDIKKFIKCKIIRFINIDNKKFDLSSSKPKKPVDDGTFAECKHLIKLSLTVSPEMHSERLLIFMDSSEIHQDEIIKESLKQMIVYKLEIKGAVNPLEQNCDGILDVFAFNSSETLNIIEIESCNSPNLFNLLKKYTNLKELTINNVICDYLARDIKLPMLTTLNILNCPLIDDRICYELFTINFENLRKLRISNCDNVIGLFLYEIKRLSGREMDIYFTNLNNKLLSEINAEKHSQNGINIKCKGYTRYNEQQISNIIKEFTEIHIDNYEYWQKMSQHWLPHGFQRILRKYYLTDDYHLNLQDFYNLNENCLKYIKSLSKIDILSLNTYYPKISNKKLIECLEGLEIKTIIIYGYKYVNVFDNQNCCDYLINDLLVKSLHQLHKIDVNNCCIGSLFFDVLKKLRISTLSLKNICFSPNMELDNGITGSLNLNNAGLKELHLSGCHNITGITFNKEEVNQLNYISMYIKDSPGIINFLKNNNEIPQDISLNLCLSADDELSNTSESSALCLMDNILFSKILTLSQITTLTLSTFYPNVNNLQDLCCLRLKGLHLINENFHENDATVDILSGFANFNPDCLKELCLKNCHINQIGIASINRFCNLKFLSFEGIDDLNTELIQQLTFESDRLKILKIIENQHVNDATCLDIVSKIELTELSVAKCENITENIFKNLTEMAPRLRHLDISGTEAGYYYLWKPLRLQHADTKLINTTGDVKFEYLNRIFMEAQTKSIIDKLPNSLIISLTSEDSLDLRDLTYLNDVAFELIAQLVELGTLKIRANYFNVRDRCLMIKNLAKINLVTIVIEGYGKTDHSGVCNDLFEEFSNNTNAKHLEEIDLINCRIDNDLLKSLCSLHDLSVLRVTNKKTNYKEIITSVFKSNGKTRCTVFVNGILLKLD